MRSLLVVGLLLSGTVTIGQVAQVTNDPTVNNWVETGSTVVLTSLLVLTFKGIFLDQRWVPAKDAEHDAKVERRLDRIITLLGQDPDEDV